MSRGVRRKTILPETAEVFYKGRWVKASEIVPERVPKTKIEEARSEIIRRVIDEIRSSPESSLTRPELIKICEEVSRERGLKRRVNYRFLLERGVLGRLKGTRRYFLTEKAKELYPELFTS